MDCLYHMHDTTDKEKQDSETSWVSSWLRRYAQSSLTKFEKLGVPIDGSSEEKDNLEIMFDKERDLSDVDKLSQVPVLFFCHLYVYQSFTWSQSDSHWVG